MQIFRCRAFADASSCIDLGSVTGTKPAATLSCAITERDTSQTRADDKHDNDCFLPGNGPVLIDRGYRGTVNAGLVMICMRLLLLSSGNVITLD